jgi:hypothetical protein
MNDISLRASNISSDNDITINATNNLAIETASETHYSSVALVLFMVQLLELGQPPQELAWKRLVVV